MIDRDSLIEKGATFRVQEFRSEELDDVFYIREINAKELDGLQVMGANFRELIEKGKPFRAMAVAKMLCDADGKRLFSDGEAQKLQTLSSRVIDEIFEAGWKYNKISKLDEVVEESEKN